MTDSQTMGKGPANIDVNVADTSKTPISAPAIVPKVNLSEETNVDKVAMRQSLFKELG